MRNRINITFLVAMALAAIPALSPAADEKAPTVADHMAHLTKGCEASAEAREARHAKTSLYERLGGYDKILAITTEIVRLHGENEAIKHTLYGVDGKMLAKHVADFMAAGTGGTAEYTGRSLPDSHAHLELTDADFLAAGGDIVKAMTTLGHGQDEIDEVVCILVSMKDQVVFK